MTRGQAKAKVKINLDSHNYFSDTDLNDSLQDSYDEVVAATGCIENVFELTTEPNRLYYNLLSLIPNYFHVVRIFSPTLKSFLEETDIRRLDRVRKDWELWRDNPCFWFPHSYERIAIVPAASSAQQLIVFYKSSASQILIDVTNFNIPLEGQYIPENFTTCDLLEQAQEYQKAGHFLKQYQNDLRKQLKLMNRALPDQVVKLEG